METYSHEIADAVRQLLDDEELKYCFKEEQGQFMFNMHTRTRIHNIVFIIQVRKEDLLFYGYCPVSPDLENPEMMAQMSEFFNRANYGMIQGCFEFDFSDGEIRFRIGVDCDHLIPSAEVIRNGIACTTAMIKRYSAGIVSIIFEGSSAKDAIGLCE